MILMLMVWLSTFLYQTHLPDEKVDDKDSWSNKDLLLLYVVH